eukprot:5708780-Pleurochrysis_carterae.AAC.9
MPAMFPFSQRHTPEKQMIARLADLWEFRPAQVFAQFQDTDSLRAGVKDLSGTEKDNDKFCRREAIWQKTQAEKKVERGSASKQQEAGKGGGDMEQGDRRQKT